MTASAVSTSTSKSSTSRFGNATHLSCRECGQTYELGATHVCAECFGPLEVAYDLPRLTRADDRGRAAQHLALRQPAARAAGRRLRAQHRAGLDPAGPG